MYPLRIKVDKSIELTVHEAISIMKSGGAVTDNHYYFGISPVRFLNGVMVDMVFLYEEFYGGPWDMFSLDKFKEHCDEHKVYRCILPVSAKDAVEAMRQGKVVIDRGPIDPKRYFIRSIAHPYHGHIERVFSCRDEDDHGVDLDCTPEEFMECNSGWYEIDDSVSEGSDADM